MSTTTTTTTTTTTSAPLVVGQSVPRVEAISKVTGLGKYAQDINVQGQLWVKFLRSPYASAKITSIDTSKAEALPGVRLVLTYQNITNYVSAPALTGGAAGVADVKPMSGIMYMVGDEVAAVCADTKEIAKQAVGLISVQYSVQPFVSDPVAAMQSGAPVVHPEIAACNGTNIYSPTAGRTAITLTQVGNTTTAFAASDVTIEHTYTTQTMQCSYTEPHAVRASWDGENLTYMEPTQSVYRLRESLALTLGLPYSKIRVIAPLTGGAFGGKLYLPRCSFLVAVMAKALRKAVAYDYSMDEDRTGATFTQRFDSVDAKLGVMKDGTITAYYGQGVMDATGYAYNIVAQCAAPSGVADMYTIPNVLSQGFGVYTNNPTGGPMRGYGSQTPLYALECLADEVCEKIGMDPVAFHIKNHIATGQVPFDATVPLSSQNMTQALNAGATAFGWTQKFLPYAQKAPQTGVLRTGVGMSMNKYGGANSGNSSAFVAIAEDGSVRVMTGSNDIGSGSPTTQAQEVADTLGVPFSSVTMVYADTSASGYDVGQYSSRTTVGTGGAVKLAAQDALAKVLALAATTLKTTAAQLSMKNGIIFVTSSPSTSVPLSTIAYANKTITGEGFYTSPVGSFVFSHFSVDFAEVQVNTLTGQVDLLNYVAVIDPGTVVNPLEMNGQTYSSVSQGMGFALSEHLILDPNTNRVLDPNFLSYGVVRATDMPQNFQCIQISVPDPNTPYGAKGGSEGQQPPALPAIANAIYNAIGVRFYNMPITRDLILAALNPSTTKATMPATKVRGE